VDLLHLYATFLFRELLILYELLRDSDGKAVLLDLFLAKYVSDVNGVGQLIQYRDWATDWTSGLRFLLRADFSLRHRIYIHLGPTQPPIQCAPGAPPRGQSGHSHPSSTEVKKRAGIVKSV
jgi:hypothetical protein